MFKFPKDSGAVLLQMASGAGARSRGVNLLAAALALGTSVSAPSYAWADARQDCQKWYDESQSTRCFECVRPVWDGHSWQLQNSCDTRLQSPMVGE
jgi:hypothetical protein